MIEFGHFASHANGMFVDGWGAGPFVIFTSARRYVFEDCRRFGPCLLDGNTLDPTGEIIPKDSQFWPAWEKWKNEGRRTEEEKAVGKGVHKTDAMYCVYTRRTRKVKP